MSFDLVLAPDGSSVPPSHAGTAEDKLADEALLATRILLVEDELMIAWMIESLLEDMGFGDIAMVSTRAQAHESVIADAPGLIVSDVNLGAGGDGIDIAVEITATIAVPVIFVTAYADDAMRQRLASRLPHAQLLRKPIQPEILRHAVLGALRKNVSN